MSCPTFSKRLPWLFCLSLAVNLFVFCSAARSQVVTIDPSFAPALQDFGSSTSDGFPTARVSVLQPDGKILVGGTFRIANLSTHSGIARFFQDGTVDESFDAGDISTVETVSQLSNGGHIREIKLLADGKILIGGSFRRGTSVPQFRSIERLNADGSLDPTFAPQITSGSINDIEIQADGKYIIGGTFQISLPNPSNNQFVTFKNLARLNPDGSFDFSFVAQNALDESNSIVLQPDGKAVVGNASSNNDLNSYLIRFNPDGSRDAVLGEFDNWITDVELQPDGKIVVGGGFVSVNDLDKRRVARFNADGSLDSTFNTGTGFFRYEVLDVEIQADGKIVIGGTFDFFNDVSRRFAARLNADGSLDASFDTSFPNGLTGTIYDVLPLPNGKIFIGGAFSFNDSFYYNVGLIDAAGAVDLSFNRASVNFGGEGRALRQQPDGKVVIVGDLHASNNILGDGYTRYNADGTVDTAFVRDTNLSVGYDVALQTDGKILIANGPNSVLLYRLNPDGTRDTGFVQPFLPFSNSIQKRTIIQRIVVQPDNKILVGGYLLVGSSTAPSIYGLARLNADGSLDPTFNHVAAFGGIRLVYDIALQIDGKIIIGGDFTQIYTNSQVQKLARINPDGIVDTSFVAPSIFGTVFELELQADGKVVFNDDDKLKRVDRDGSLDQGFNVSVNNNGSLLDIVRALLVLPSGKIMVGGNFISVNGTPRNRIARLNPNGTLDLSFDLPGGANDVVHDFSLQADGRILVGGAFTRLGGLSRIGAARLVPGSSANLRFDFDGDGKSDIAVYRGGVWHLLQSANGYATVNFGLAGDRLAPADYDGDGKCDFGVYRDGTWYLLRSSQGFGAVQFGLADDIPQAADFDGDGRSEIAVFRPSNGVWYMYNLATGQTGIVQFGIGEDKPVAADFTGDGRAEIAVWRPSTGDWYQLNPATNGFAVFHFGQTGDVPLPADYDGDGRVDFAVFRGGVWYLQKSTEGFAALGFGLAGDAPTPADFDGDGRANISVFRQGVWYYLNSTNGAIVQQFGLDGDMPVQSAFVQ